MGAIHEAIGSRPAGRPREFDRSQVLEAGYGLLEKGGIDALTIRALSQASGTTVTSIYRNLGNREAVLSAILDAYAPKVEATELPDDPRGIVLTLFTHAYDVLAPQTWALQVLSQSGQFGAGAMRYAEHFFCAADAAGMDETESLLLYRQLWAYTFGALQTAAPDDSPAHRAPHVAQKIAQLAEEDGFTRIRRFLDHGNGLTRGGFIAGLRALISTTALANGAG